MADDVSVIRTLARSTKQAKQVNTLAAADQILAYHETPRGKPDLRRVSQDALPSRAGLADGSETVGFAAGALSTNSSPRLLTDKISNGGTRVDIRDYASYGLDPTGATSSALAIQAAIDDCPQFGHVYIPPPDDFGRESFPRQYYLLTDPDGDGHCLTFPRSDICIYADPQFRQPQFYCATAGKNLFFSEYKNIGFDGIAFYGDGLLSSAGQYATCYGFKTRRTDDNADLDGFIRNCAFYGLWRAADLRGRNFDFENNTCTGFIQGLYLEPSDPAANVSNNETMRGVVARNIRFHSSGGDLYEAAVTGTAQSGSTSSTIKLAADDAAIANAYKGWVITVLTGTAAGQSNLVIANNATTKFATVKETWTVTPAAGDTYALTSPHVWAAGMWVDPGAYSGSYEYGQMLIGSYFNGVCRAFVGPTRGTLISGNNCQNMEGNSHTTVAGVNGGLAYNGCIVLLPSGSGEEYSGLVTGNILKGFDQDASSIGIQVFGANAVISNNTISGMQREGIKFESTSLRNLSEGNLIHQCSGASVGVYSAQRDLGTENIFGSLTVTCSEGSRRHLHGMDASGTRARITQRPAVSANAFISKRLNIGSGGTYGIVSAIPPTVTMLTFELGDSVELDVPAAAGAWKAFCTTAGTLGTLAITATAAASTSLTAVSSTTNLRKGQWLLIAGDATPRRIVAISGTTVTLGAATTASGAGLAVSWQAPAFKSVGSLAA